MDLKWDKTPLLITVALSSSSYCHQKRKNQDGERRTNHRGCLIWIVLYLPQLAELVFSGVFAMSAGESGFLSPPDASSRFLHAVLKRPGTFSSCCLLLSWTWYAFCHLTPLGEIHGGPFPSESPTSGWNVAPCTPPALQRAIKGWDGNYCLGSQNKHFHAGSYFRKSCSLSVEELPRCAFMKRNDHLKSVGLLLQVFSCEHLGCAAYWFLPSSC